AILGLRRQCVLERERTNLFRQINGVTAHDRTKGPAAAAELWNARRAVTGTAGAFLRVHFLTGSPDFAAALRLVRTALTLGELPIDAALDDVGPRLEAEDRIRQLDRTGFLPFEGGDLHFHVTHPPSRRERLPRLQVRRPVFPRHSGQTWRPACSRASARRFR